MIETKDSIQRADGSQSVAARPVQRLRDGVFADADDCLVVEEPLEIRVGDRSFTVTMRTPGSDFELTRGLLFTEGVIRSNDDICQIRYCDAGDPGETEADNIINVRLKASAPSGLQWQRNLMSGSSCGLCGKAALEAVTASVCGIENQGEVKSSVLLGLPDAMRRHQKLFDQTGGLHAAALFTGTGNCLAVFEDIGRHNATDKAIGRGLQEGWLPRNDSDKPIVLLVSGRASFEIVQKALVARIPIVCSVSAASSLAVDLASANNLTLVGFLRGAGMTVYTGGERIVA